MSTAEEKFNPARNVDEISRRIVCEAKSGIKVSEHEFTCPGAMGPIKAGHPDAADIENFKAFVRSVIGK